MKIIQVQTQAEAAGAQRVSDMVGAGLRARGHQVRTVFMYRKTDAYDADPHADFVSRTPPGGLAGQAWAALGLIRYLRAEKPAVVITYQYWGNLFGTIGGRLAGAKCLIANQSGKPMTSGLLGIASRLDRLIGTWGWYDHNIVNSAWTRAQFEAYPPAYKNRLRLIEHGVASPDLKHDKTAARARFGLPGEVPLVISTGRQTREKNQRALVAALAHLPGVHLAIAGVGPDHDELVEMAEKAGLGGRLHMVGEISAAEIPVFLAAGDVFAFASLFETFGLSVAEAAINGVPVVANDLPVLHEVLGDGDHAAALFAPAHEPQVFARAVENVLADPALAESLAAAGRNLRQKYAPEAMCAAYEALLDTR
ncbi:glycosyltransferase family 4 protein [Mariluticola halotolerans]|uniref:glycosyltransferase family 4 protein n=1 Tax=Mariluticola halotolerans TaxID=2909283 RepID=UPI0026E204A7|nr:glycosyltransferase family 4 protein [Mariluticola halotolerans]UJQ96089.1 glycosyltransferase family 4 protein [Mariluticola halotolerans]